MSKKFRVEDKETIADCLDRMKKEGFMPIRRIEKPVYKENKDCLLYTSPSPRDQRGSRMPSSA